ncbi:hypothetical protein L218DRAFT_912079 [Marasmius fiardii PR-910]|nr:hypothetical protein L218DRAFT_912079 [Marasmius fiardii PR-910]
MSAITTTLALGFVLSVSTFYFNRKREGTLKGNGYILWNQVNHARLLPAESSHAFTYSTIALFVSLKSLENRCLDLGYGRIFGYGGKHGRLVGLRAKSYLFDSVERSIRKKLVALLEQRGFMDGKERVVEDAWMLTMPSYLGFEGINPLTVYFCYQPGDVLWLVVLEVHNTFGESHVYVLEVGVNEDAVKSASFDHRWTFPRAFHVSPFNDRAGFYTVSIRNPSHSPSNPVPTSPLLPVVSIHLHTPSSDLATPGPLKLTALLRSTYSIPLTTPNLLKTLLNYPLTLFLSLPRIFYHAWILHYKKRLDVYIRPEPFPVSLPTKDEAATTTTTSSGGVRWQGISFFEAYCRNHIHGFLEAKSTELGIRVELSSADPSVSNAVFTPVSHAPLPRTSDDHGTDNTLKIHYLTPRFYTILFLSPSPAHAYLLGVKTEKLFEVSDKQTFIQMFQLKEPSSGGTPTSLSLSQHLRCLPLPQNLLTSTSTTLGLSMAIPRNHPLDNNARWTSSVVVASLLFLGWLERGVFKLMSARVVLGDAPWEEWKRAEEVLTCDEEAVLKRRVGGEERGGVVGSVRS